MINFSESKQSFYMTGANYINLPNDLVMVTNAQHISLLNKINEGCHVNSDLTCSEPKPSFYHVWQNGEWVDTRTGDERYQQYLSKLKPLTRRQFKLALLENNLIDKIQPVINGVENKTTRQMIQIEYDESTEFGRLNPSIVTIFNLLGLTDEQVNQIWEYALTL